MANEPQQPSPCPICGNPVSTAHKPFCSRRCAEVDLHRWLKGAYVIAGEASDDETWSPPADEMVREGSKH
jgi:uncharacterized protein